MKAVTWHGRRDVRVDGAGDEHQSHAVGPRV
jgi:hypothetical protein